MIAAELARQLGLKLEGDLAEVVGELRGICASKCCLMILDNVEDEAPGELVPGGAASVLVTTRRTNLRFLQFRQPLTLPLFTDEQCFDLFRQQLERDTVAQYEVECKQLFTRLERLPIGISVSAGLVRYDVRYTIASLVKNLPADVSALIREAIEALNPEARRLLAAMSACAPEGFELDLAATIGSLNEETALAALQILVERSLTDEVDRTGRRYRLHAMVRDAAGGQAFGKQHAEAIDSRFKNWEKNWRQCEIDLPDFRLALEWALGTAGEPNFSSNSLAYCGFLLTMRIGRLAEALEICQQMERTKDSQESQLWLGNRALILQVWGRLEDALALHREVGDMCLEMGKQDALGVSYGNQALVLGSLGRLGEALALHKKEEAICLELGDKDGLQSSYGNQALILREWGHLEEAFALHKQQEAICWGTGQQGESAAHIQQPGGDPADVGTTGGSVESAAETRSHLSGA